ncbi:MAG: formylglycine-generating enzyme family protein [Opitutaceae bacterium]
MKKSSKRNLSHETSGAKRALQVFLVILAAVAVLALFWFLSKLGPQGVEESRSNIHVVASEEVLALKAKSIELEAQFEQVLAIRDAEVRDVSLLKEALDFQDQYLAEYTGVDSDAVKRRNNLNQRYQDLAASELRRDSMTLEDEAEKHAAAKEYEVARGKYTEAFLMQKEINDEFPASNGYDVSRATRLERQARYLTAQPLFERSLKFESEADAYIKAEDWKTAEERLQVAISIQDQLNREYRGTNQASVSRLENLRVKLVGIRSGQSYLEIERVSDLADGSHASGQHLEAAELYLEAVRLQRLLNEQYVDSPYASAERVSEFQRKAQTSQSFELGRTIERNHDHLKGLLADRRTYEAAEVIAKLRRDIKQMSEAYPRSSLNDEELQLKVRYLNLVQNDLGFIQDRVYDSMLPIPEETAWVMLKTEVPQALYSLIMGTNPSRNQGDVNPVDSVSWTEAKRFCDRLSWIMGKSVRLPTENEFRQALGRLRYVVLEDHVWSASDAGGMARAVGQKQPFASGYFDLLGNVSEWLESVDRFDDEDARHIGGHAQDRLEAIFTVPMREAPRGERNRMTGFRFVVNTSE